MFAKEEWVILEFYGGGTMRVTKQDIAKYEALYGVPLQRCKIIETPQEKKGE